MGLPFQSKLKMRQRTFLLLACLALAAFTQAAGEKPRAARRGDHAPPLTWEQLLQGPEGAAAGWEALQGKAVVLEFWATWCSPCVEQIPHLNQLAETFKEKPVQFIAISDEEEPVVRKFLQARPIRGWVGIDADRSMFDSYGAGGLPTTVLVDPEGVIAAVTYPERVNEAVLEELLTGRRPRVLPKGATRIFWDPSDKPDDVAAAPITDRAEGGQPALFHVLIRPAKPDGGMHMELGKGTFTARGLTFRAAVSHAYDVPRSHLVLPAWLAGTTYDFEIVTPKGSSGRLRPLFQQALRETFGLAVRREVRELDVLVLRTSSARAPALRPPEAKSEGIILALGQVEGRRQTVSSLVKALEDLLGRPVFDKTHLEGKYDFEVYWDSEDPDGIFHGVREYLGLDLIPARRAVEVLVVELKDPPLAH